MNKVKLLLLLMIMLLCSCEKNGSTDFNGKAHENKMIEEISSYNESLTEDFLKYINGNYGYEVLGSIYDRMISGTYDETIWHQLTGKSLNVLEDYYNGGYSDRDDVRITYDDKKTMSFVGDISLADNFEIMPRYDERGEGVNGILGDDVLNIMRESSVMTANNEFTVSDRGVAMANKLYTFRANPKRLKIYKEMGVDMVSIANNHSYDFGEEAFLDTLSSLKNNGIAYIGGGSNIKEASKAFYYIINGYKVAFLAATRAEKNIKTPEATTNSSGVFRCYNPEKLISRIREEKEVSDLVVVLIHWGKEDSHELEEVQIETGKMYIDAGADLIVGSHAHFLQGMQFYNNKLIAYNLGDFIFNGESKDTGILRAVVTDDGKLEYNFIPCRQSNYKTTLLDGSEWVRVLNDMRRYSINTVFDDSGKFYQKG